MRPFEVHKKIIWRWESSDVLKVYMQSITSDAFPVRKGFLRITSTALVRYRKLKRVGEVPQTEVMYGRERRGEAAPTHPNPPQPSDSSFVSQALCPGQLLRGCSVPHRQDEDAEHAELLDPYEADIRPEP
jgi:hypothetical protein